MKKIIAVQQKTIYYREGDGSKLLFVLHGYGQLAKFFIRQFKHLTHEGYTVIAPEGLHHFYLEGTSGRVGASWMTSENREQDIHNYLAYLKEVFQHIQSEKNGKKFQFWVLVKVYSTAFRWIAEGYLRPKQFLICSGLIPPDVDLVLNKMVFNPIKMTYFSGIHDPYRTEASVKQFYEDVTKNKFEMGLVNFEGVHEVSIAGITEQLMKN